MFVHVIAMKCSNLFGVQIQHMMKVKSKNEDLLEANAGLQTDNTRLQADAARLQSEVKKLQQESKGKSTDFDADLQVPF